MSSSRNTVTETTTVTIQHVHSTAIERSEAIGDDDNTSDAGGDTRPGVSSEASSEASSTRENEEARKFRRNLMVFVIIIGFAVFLTIMGWQYLALGATVGIMAKGLAEAWRFISRR